MDGCGINHTYCTLLLHLGACQISLTDKSGMLSRSCLKTVLPHFLPSSIPLLHILLFQTLLNLYNDQEPEVQRYNAVYIGGAATYVDHNLLFLSL